MCLGEFPKVVIGLTQDSEEDCSVMADCLEVGKGVRMSIKN